MDPNNPNQPTDQPNLPQNDMPQQDTTLQATPNDQPAITQNPVTEQPEAPITNPSGSNNDQMQNTTTPNDPNAQSNSDDDLEDETYTEDFGNYIIDFLDNIDTDEDLLQKVANEMRLDKDRVKEILAGLLEKIDQEQITPEELALIMTSPVADENSNNE